MSLLLEENFLYFYSSISFTDVFLILRQCHNKIMSEISSIVRMKFAKIHHCELKSFPEYRKV